MSFQVPEKVLRYSVVPTKHPCVEGERTLQSRVLHADACGTKGILFTARRLTFFIEKVRRIPNLGFFITHIGLFLEGTEKGKECSQNALSGTYHETIWNVGLACYIFVSKSVPDGHNAIPRGIFTP